VLVNTSTVDHMLVQSIKKTFKNVLANAIINWLINEEVFSSLWSI